MSYLPYWLTFFKTNFWLVFNTFTSKVNFKKAVYLNLYQFQFTIITSRTTIYVLFLFWCFFFFFGEFLLLITFNMNTLNDLIPSNYFTFFKTHTIFLLDNNNNYLTEVIMFYILFFTTSSFLFLFNLKYTFIYESFYHQLILDIVFFVIVLLLFQWTLVFLLYTAVILKRLNSF